MGHGVPFITRRGAISGGEIENIRDGFNGVLCGPTIDSLEQAFERVSTDSELARRLGMNALTYYQRYCTIYAMAGGFISAIEGIHEEWSSPLGDSIA
jgi:hypothetical protein